MENVGMSILGILFIAAGVFVVGGTEALLVMLVIVLVIMGSFLLAGGISGLIKDHDK